MRHLRHTTLTSALFFVLLPVFFAQKTADLKKSGERYFENRRWHEAMLAYSEYQQIKPGDEKVLTRLGICSYHLHHAEKALQYLEYVLSKNPQSKDPDLFYYLAKTFHGQRDFARAITFYKFYLKNAADKHPLRAGAVDEVKRCVTALDLRPNELVALVENLGEQVNTVGDEFNPIPSVNHSDRLYFSAAREGCTGGVRNAEGLEDEFGGHWCSDMFFTSATSSGWDFAEPMGALLNTSRHEMALGFNENGRVLYYFRGFTLFSGDMLADTAGRSDEYALEQPTFVCPMRPEDGDQAPFFFNDTTLIFSSRRAGGLGGLDLYLTQFSGGQWTTPANLGEPINTPYDETTPFLAPDGRTLFFSHNGTSSMGGLDIFKSAFDDKKRAWSVPQNLGNNVNSPGEDAFFRLSKDGKSAWFSSDRLESFGERDLYILYFKNEARPELRASAPVLFCDVGKVPQEIANENDNSETETILLSPLNYDSDRDFTNPENLKTLNEAAAFAQNHPDLAVLVTVHTDETGPAKFDLYYGIKRAEIVGKLLRERGLASNRLVLQSAGPFYPLAKNVIGQEPNPTGQRLNRRVEVTFSTIGNKLALGAQVKRPVVPEIMASDAWQDLEEGNEGLSYRVEVATTRQILNNDDLAMFGDLLIESAYGSGTYRYTAGLFKSFENARNQKNELQKQGFPDATIIAYVNGIRISKAEAVGLVKKYPDLAPYTKS